MSREGQRLQPGRYTIVPRTLSFLLRGEEVLLLRLAPNRGAWAGCLNGIGGHIEAGEDPLTSARREISEEAGLTAAGLRLCGMILIDVGGSPGIGLYAFVGEADPGKLRAGPEGSPVWVPLTALGQERLVEDLPTLLPPLLRCHRDRTVLSAHYTYDPAGQLSITFAD
jgi:8-oxo-dGTP diphosphatase